MELLARVRRFIARYHLADRGTRVLVAVSGGSDSVALAHLLRELAGAGELSIAGIAHFNHQLRETADRDERLTVTLADSFGWRIAIEREDVAARARRERRSIEDAARTARHEFFERARTALGADVEAHGHTRDDQAETFLLRLRRGAGPKGLAAMHPRRGTIVRPLLSSRRDELRAYLTARQIQYADDETNTDVAIPRNRVRAELLPFLKRRFNPAIVDVLADEAELARETWLWMESESLRPDVSPAGQPDVPDEAQGFGLQAFEFDVAALKAASPAMRRFALWKAMNVASGGRPVSFRHVDAALELLESEAARSVDLPGHTVQRLGGRLVLTSSVPDAGGRAQDGPNFFEYLLSIPGEVPLPQAGCVLAAESCPADIDPGTLTPDASAAAVRRDLCIGQWRVRSRRPGDYFRPVGLGGRKKLQDYFVDRKVAWHLRDGVPLVVDERDRIVWVAGFGIDEAFRVTDPAQAVIILRLKLLGGPA
jgi:tRNA(Ile)-lysidine synthase